jgi:hypothetical protein
MNNLDPMLALEDAVALRESAAASPAPGQRRGQHYAVGHAGGGRANSVRRA